MSFSCKAFLEQLRRERNLNVYIFVLTEQSYLLCRRVIRKSLFFGRHFSIYFNAYIEKNQFVRDANASTTFPACSLRVLSAMVLEISISSTMRSTSSFLIDTLASSFSFALRFSASSTCLVSTEKKHNLCAHHCLTHFFRSGF